MIFAINLYTYMTRSACRIVKLVPPSHKSSKTIAVKAVRIWVQYLTKLKETQGYVLDFINMSFTRKNTRSSRSSLSPLASFVWRSGKNAAAHLSFREAHE